MKTVPHEGEIEEIRAAIMRIMATTSKLNAETSMISHQRFLISLSVFGGVFAAMAIVGIKLLG